ncbi:hypothetical protein [Flavivirga jejuensis]|uniref:Secreted protein (Por secretion system target) n=1 Tax=Flavivirga jejuensis TaxID=870487 RepID=A0ABT8WR12_9FLAO|nr:hypothetical protein [Flavivirga jejuensis]MDO5975342.1 hypothetical protein [Flavivirga jejuensis]
MGLRIQGVYPNRVDVVFDLENGKVKGYKGTQDFQNVHTTIESLDDGWYKCSLNLDVAADKIRIILDPTTSEK